MSQILFFHQPRDLFQLHASSCDDTDLFNGNGRRQRDRHAHSLIKEISLLLQPAWSRGWRTCHSTRNVEAEPTKNPVIFHTVLISTKTILNLLPPFSRPQSKMTKYLGFYNFIFKDQFGRWSAWLHCKVRNEVLGEWCLGTEWLWMRAQRGSWQQSWWGGTLESSTKINVQEFHYSYDSSTGKSQSWIVALLNKASSRNKGHQLVLLRREGSSLSGIHPTWMRRTLIFRRLARTGRVRSR